MIDETTILFSTQEEVIRYRKRRAATSSDASLGVSVTTPDALVRELWDVWGARERLVSAWQRKMIIKMLLDEQDGWVASAGTVDLLADFVRDFITYLDDDFRVVHRDEFSPTDEEIMDFVRRYEDALTQRGLIEGAQAVRMLASLITLPAVTLRTQKTLPAFMRTFLGQVAETVQEAPAQLEPLIPEQRSQEYLLLEPTGPTAMVLMVFAAIDEGEPGQRVLVTAPDPEMLFESMREALLERGYRVSLKTMRPFRSSYFGRAYTAAATVLDPARQASPAALLAAALTYVRSPYAQLSSHQQIELEQHLRADRTLAREDVVALLGQASRSFEFFEALLQESDADVLFSFFDHIAHRAALDEAERAGELALLARMKTLYQDARVCGLDPDAFFDQVDALSVPYAVSWAPSGSPETESGGVLEERSFFDAGDDTGGWVLFTTFDAAARYPARSVDTVVMTELDAIHYGCMQRQSTLSEFLLRYQLPYQETARKEAQDRFEWNRSLACNRVVLEYAQHDLAGDECYPAFFLEEFLSRKKQEDEGVSVRSCGETKFDLTARLLPVDRQRVLYEEAVTRGVLTDQERAQLLVHQQDESGTERIVLSASALEAYRRCPYRWFVERKLRLEDAGEAFGPLETGTFVHRVFQTFYDEWADGGHTRVTAETLEPALALLGEVFDRLVAEQEAREPGDRLIAIDELERGQIAKLRLQVLECLSLQKGIFPSYHVEGHELELVPEDRIVYGGAIIQGRIDRIDVDNQGNFVVIDYKGRTVGHDADFAGFDDAESFVAPEKIQALIYAQALRRRNPALHPKGALYLSYRAKKPSELLRGALVETMPECNVFASKKTMIEGNFESYLDLVERDLEKTIERMERGEIAPDPRTKKACDHCPVLYCEKRIDGSE